MSFIRFFSQIGWCHFEIPYSSYAARQTFDETDILPIEFSCHGIQKPSLSHVTLTSTLFSPFSARQGRILLHSATRHSVDAPLHFLCLEHWMLLPFFVCFFLHFLFSGTVRTTVFTKSAVTWALFDIQMYTSGFGEIIPHFVIFGFGTFIPVLEIWLFLFWIGFLCVYTW